MSYTVIARKWRPQNFSDLVGQEHVARTLVNAMSTGRIAHGYIFTGPRGVGKTSSARLFAKAVNCTTLENGEPCNTCASCKEITQGNSLDVVEIDGASNNSVDNIRDLRDNVRFLPTNGRYKIYIIDEVHMLSKGAFNALLKTLEEPPKHVIFIFATTEIHKVLPTILSRCQRFDFKRIPTAKIMERLQYICAQEAIDIETDALLQIAKKADGGMRDSQSLLDQIISFCGKSISLEDVNASLGIIRQDLFFELCESFIEKDTGKAIQLVNDVFQDGYDLTELIHGLEEHFRQLLICLSMDSHELLDTVEDFKQKFIDQSKHFSQKDVLRMVEIVQETERSVKTGQFPKLKLELAFSKICQMDKSVELNELLNVLNGQKKKPENVAPIKPSRAIGPKPVSVPTPSEGTSKITAAPQKPTPEPLNNPRSSDVSKTLTLNELQSVWKQLTQMFKTSKPSLYGCMFQSVVHAIDGLVLKVGFNHDSAGKNASQMLVRNKAYVEKCVSEKVHQKITIELLTLDFKSLGIEIEYKDIESVVKRIREKDKIANQIIESFGLEPDSFGG